VYFQIPLLRRGGRRSLTGWFMRNTQRYMALPFNPKLKERAKELRKAGMLHEALLWNQLKRKQFNGLDFDRQKIIGNFIVDFFCAERAVVIEADGASHQGHEDYDRERDAYLNGLGLTVIRIAVKDILQDIEAVMAFLRNHPALSGTPPQEGNFQPAER
jgi:very-short-patch-repair endonuclease